jgi:hypothetical protein
LVLNTINGPGRKGFGQVFEVPATESYLNSFSFWMQQPAIFGNSLFRAHLATWDDATNSFSDVWTRVERNVTSPMATSAPGPLSNWGEQLFDPGIQLTAGATYVAYLDLSQVLDFVGSRSGDYLAYRVVAADGTTGLVKFKQGEYAKKWDTEELAFKATFSAGAPTATPEPSTVFLLATGLIGMGGMGWVRRRKNS